MRVWSATVKSDRTCLVIVWVLRVLPVLAPMAWLIVALKIVFLSFLLKKTNGRAGRRCHVHIV